LFEENTGFSSFRKNKYCIDDAINDANILLEKNSKQRKFRHTIQSYI